MKWIAYGVVGLCAGAFVGWGAYVSFIEEPLFGADASGGVWLDLLAAFLGAILGAIAAVAFGWLIRRRH